MANSLNLATLVTLAVSAALLGHTSAETYTIGGARGWTFANASFYQDFADQYNFTVGDILVFNFTTAQHNVAIVSQPSYDACDGSSPIAFYRDGPANITLNTTEPTYFICSVGQHCVSAGMKFAINVTPSAPPPSGGGSTPSAPPPSGSTPSAPPPSGGGTTPSSPPPLGGGTTPSAPPPSAASRTDLVSIFTIFISAAIYLLC